MRRSLDQIFWGACTFHDYCWADCNGPEPPYHDQPWKLGCNAAFYEWMVTACNRRADQETFPIDNLQNRDQFLAFCKDTALAFALAVSTGFAEDAFYDSQCRRGCNPDACSLMGMPLPYACGHGQCYNSPPGSGGGDPGGGSTCDIDGDGWVTPEECVFDCHGYVDGDECRPI